MPDPVEPGTFAERKDTIANFLVSDFYPGVVPQRRGAGERALLACVGEEQPAIGVWTSVETRR